MRIWNLDDNTTFGFLGNLDDGFLGNLDDGFL